MSGAVDGRRLLWLRSQWAVVAVAAAVLLVAGHRLIAGWWTFGHAGRWALVAGAVLAYQLWLLWRGLDTNYRERDGSPRSTLGVGNAITVARGMLIAVVAGHLLVPEPAGPLAWLPGTCYAAAVLLDFLDGSVARLLDQATVLGETLDLQFDALGILVAPALGVLHGELPPWYLAASAAYYLFFAGKWLRRVRGLPVHSLPESGLRRPLAGLQMAVVAVALLPAFGPPLTTWLATAALVPFLAGFARDWLAVSGRLDAV